MQGSNSVAFRMSYLLGVGVSILHENFPEEMEKSLDLKAFKNYKDAKTLRSINIIRQFILHNAIRLRGKHIGITSYYNDDNELAVSVAQLLEENIKVMSIFKDIDEESFTLCDVFNVISEMISIISYKVMVDLDMPYIDEMGKYFYFPEIIDMKELASFYLETFNVKSPFNIFIYKAENIKQTFKYALYTDNACIKSIFSMYNKSFENKVEENSFVYRTEMGEDLDEDAVIDQNKILEDYKNKKIETTVIVSESKKEEVKQEIVGCTAIIKEENNIEVVEENKNDDVIINGSTIFVDCLTINYFGFMGFLNNMEKDNIAIHKVILFDIPNRQSFWSVFTEVYKGKYNVINVDILSLSKQNNIFDENSVGMIIASEIQKYVCEQDIKDILVLSGRKGFCDLTFHVLENDFNIAFSSTLISAAYYEYLKKQIPNTFDVDKYMLSEEEVTKKTITYLMLKALKNLTLAEWNINTLTSFVITHAYQEIESLNKIEVSNFIKEQFDNVKVSIKDKEVILSLDGILV